MSQEKGLATRQVEYIISTISFAIIFVGLMLMLFQISPHETKLLMIGCFIIITAIFSGIVVAISTSRGVE